MRTTHVWIALAALVVSPLVPQAKSQEKTASLQGPSIGNLVSLQQQEERARMVTLLAILGAPLLPPIVVQDQPSPPPAGHKTAAVAHVSQRRENEGERIFQQNCNRCHNAPEGFSPSMAGTIVRHMRVRASLSQHEEDELLRFFNP